MAIFVDAQTDAADLASLVNESGLFTTRYGDNPKKSWLYMQGEFDALLTSFEGQGDTAIDAINADVVTVGAVKDAALTTINGYVSAIDTSKDNAIITIDNYMSDVENSASAAISSINANKVTIENAAANVDATIAELDSKYKLTAIGVDGVWQSGIDFTAYNQYLVFSGTAYQPKPETSLPYTTGASPDLNDVQPVAPNTADKIFVDNGGTIQDQLDGREFDTVADAIAFTKIDKLLGNRVYLKDRQAYFDVVDFSAITSNDLTKIQSTANSLYGFTISSGYSKYSLESIGYDGTNAQDCIYVAATESLPVFGYDLTYFASNTVLIPKEGLTLSSVTGGYTGFVIKTTNDFPVGANILDTENYDYLHANSVKVANPDNPSDISAPKNISIKGVTFKGSYDGSYLPSPNQGEGIGARIYGRFIDIDLRVEDVENVGCLTYYPTTDGGVVAGNNDDLQLELGHIHVKTQNTGREGFIFDGPSDSTLGDINCRDASASNFQLLDTSPVDSVEYPDTEKLSPAIDIRKACHHQGFMNGFGTRNGWSTVISNNRFDSSGHVQVDSSDGGLFVRNGAWAQFASIEFHGMTYGFIQHSGELRPCILSESVQGFICQNIKGELAGNWQDRPLIDIQGAGSSVNAVITPRYGDLPSNVGRLVKVSGSEHNVRMDLIGSISGSDCVAFTLSSLIRSTVAGNVRFASSGVMVDLDGLDGSIDKTNTIDINYVSSLGNATGTVLGVDKLTSSDLKRANITVRSTGEDKDYSTRSVGVSSAVAVSDSTVSTGVVHNFLGAPRVEDIKLTFIPASVADVLPDITNISIQFITAFTVNVQYTMTGGSGGVKVKVEV